MNPKVEIFSQGEEVVRGQTVDTNAAWLAAQLVQMGFEITRHTAVGDKLEDLVTLLQEIADRADCCICTGGLGPTVDDLTAAAVATAFDAPLEFDATAYEQISAFFQSRNRPMPGSNRKQAMFPKGALRLDNQWGTAPGFALQYKRCWFVFLPGVPYEMRQMYQHKIEPLLETRYTLNPWTQVTIKTVGMGESDIQERLHAIDFPDGVQLSFCAGANEVQTKVMFPPHFKFKEMKSITQSVEDKLGDAVFIIEGLDGKEGDLVSVVGAALMHEGKTLAVVETISHGLLASKCLGQPWLLEALVAQNVDKIFFRLGLSLKEEELLEKASRLAAAMQVQSDADYILVQLYNGSELALKNDKQTVSVITVLISEHGLQQQQKQVSGNIMRKQNQAAIIALDFIRRVLQKKTELES
jgi:competence/damage-inducible protein CinA-like protein